MSDMRIATQPISISNLPQAKNDLELRSLRNASKTGSAAKIDKAAHDFESILVGQWLEKAEKSFATVPGADPDQDSDSGHDQFQSIACQFMAQGLTKNGSFGIATMISKHLTAVAAKQTGESANPAAADSSGAGTSKLKNDK
jgi:Rod binding domain-containing protein